MQTRGCCWYFGVLEHYRELTETRKVFEDLPGPSPVVKPKGIGGTSRWQRLYYQGLMLRGTWQAIDNAHQKAEKSSA